MLPNKRPREDRHHLTSGCGWNVDVRIRSLPGRCVGRGFHRSSLVDCSVLPGLGCLISCQGKKSRYPAHRPGWMAEKAAASNHDPISFQKRFKAECDRVTGLDGMVFLRGFKKSSRFGI